MSAVGRRLDIAKQHATDVTATLNAEVTIQNMNNHEQSNNFSGTTVRAIPTGGRIQIISTAPISLGKVLPPLHWLDHKLDDFPDAIAKVATAAEALFSISFLASVSVTPITQPNQLKKALQSIDSNHVKEMPFTRILVFPCLPDEGVGGATKLRRLKRRSEDTELYDVDRAEKLKSIPQDEFVSRQEKDFLSIMMKEMLEFRKNVSISSKSGESPQEAMASYKNLLSHPSDEGQGNHFHLELVKAVCTEIQKVGDQGSSIEDVYSLVRMPGEQAPEIFILALQEFGRDQIVYYSVMIKAADNLDQETYGMKLHGHTKLGEGKHKNQNHALVITCGEAFQTVDTIQDNCMK
ncbi:hypothetical protein Gotri_015277 [Gossypium trilobum]|uniref:Uncharacterized protein n=1 Tax=Gossypium trilobum TaxID=34281 RepID=A0A7J9DZQ1_9ROSI|nr:hypothetical protein [Gossypium trilobum]